MSPFSKISPANGGELKAILFALLFCGLFIALLSGFYRPPVRKKKPRSFDVTVPAPAPPAKILENETAPYAGMSENFPVVPEIFKKVDFKNHSYVIYIAPVVQMNVSLSNGEFELPNNSGWLRLSDVYYKDVTGDGTAEAIVRLAQVKCNGSCDGGADLFYIYEMRNRQPKTIWQYQTGSRAYGCSLKSLTVAEKQLVLELFGWCPQEAMEDPGSAKFVVTGLTYKLFEFDGWRFANKKTEYFTTASSTDVKNYEPRISLF